MPAQLMQAAGGAEITITKNGYLFVFLSSESQGTVYFDDLSIQHTPGNLLEEHHYYPTGLEMFALSSSASNGHVRNRYGYQGQERENTFALNLNEFEARHYDPQTGRWMVPDPANQFPSPYVGMGNQWVSGVDPDGRWVNIAVAAVANIIAHKDQIKKATEGEKGNAWRGIGMALGYGAVGALGTMGIDRYGAFIGFNIGGSLNVAFEGLTGQFKDKGDQDINLFGRMAGSYLTGGSSALAGKNYKDSKNDGADLSDVQNDILLNSEAFSFYPFKGSSLLKFGLSGLQNLASNLNKHNGKLELGQIGGLFFAGSLSGLTTYSSNFIGYSQIPMRLNRSSFSFGLSSIATPLLSNGITDIGLNYANYWITEGKTPKNFKSFYKNYLKSFNKIGLYTFSSALGYFSNQPIPRIYDRIPGPLNAPFFARK